MAIVRNTPIKADVVRKAKKLSSTERIEANRDKPRADPLPEPSMLRVYRVKTAKP